MSGRSNERPFSALMTVLMPVTTAEIIRLMKPMMPLTAVLMVLVMPSQMSDTILASAFQALFQPCLMLAAAVSRAFFTPVQKSPQPCWIFAQRSAAISFTLVQQVFHTSLMFSPAADRSSAIFSPNRSMPLQMSSPCLRRLSITATRITATAATISRGQLPIREITLSIRVPNPIRIAFKTEDRMNVPICGSRAAPKTARSRGQWLFRSFPS